MVPIDPSVGDDALLKAWINPVYLDPKTASTVCARFEKDSSVQLQGFLRNDRLAAVREELLAADAASGLGRGGRGDPKVAGDGWELVGPPHMQRYARASVTGGARTGVLQTLRDELFRSTSFARLLERLTGGHLTEHRVQARRFRPGLDYTVGHHGLLEDVERLDATLCFVDDTDAADADLWASGDVGGFECFIAAEDEGEAAAAAEVYANAGAEENDLLSVNPVANTLSLVLRDQGTMSFVKYVAASAPSSRFDIAAAFGIEYDDDDDDNDDDDDGNEVDSSESGAAEK